MNNIMINDLKISYVYDRDIDVTLHVGTDYEDNLPYNLANIFAKVAEDSDVNEQLLIDNLKSMLEYEEDN